MSDYAGACAAITGMYSLRRTMFNVSMHVLLMHFPWCFRLSYSPHAHGVMHRCLAHHSA